MCGMTTVFNWKFANRLSKMGSHILMVKKPVPQIRLFKNTLPHIFLQMSWGVNVMMFI